MPTNVDIPNLGDSVTEATLIKWLKPDGALVTEAEPLAELETDKANADVPSPTGGVVRHAVAEGEVVRIGQTIARIETAGSPGAKAPSAVNAPVANAGDNVATNAPKPAAASASAGSASGASASGVLAAEAISVSESATSASHAVEDLSPATRRIVTESKIDPSTVPGTGRGGRLTKEDVQDAIDRKPADVKPADGKTGDAKRGDGKLVADQSVEASVALGDSEPDHAPAPARQPAPPSPRVAAPAPAAPRMSAVEKMVFDSTGVKRVPMSKMRKAIARRLVEAQHTAAILTTFNEVDLTAIIDIRAKYKQRFTDVHGIGLGFMSFFAKAVCMALAEFPRVNAQIDGDDVVYNQQINLGIAVSTERGLAVPVLRSAGGMGFAKIESEIKRLANAVRDGKLGIEELSGGTFTITNGGVFGSMLSTPIINPPQSAILGMHAIQKRPMVVNDKIEIRQMMYTALSYDHRLVDGRESVSFLVRIKELLEDPTRLMLEI
jgi:2-oxoglutarate dehydrogenase E2 component (dihydrolipoamide succinyltransferase)